MNNPHQRRLNQAVIDYFQLLDKLTTGQEGQRKLPLQMAEQLAPWLLLAARLEEVTDMLADQLPTAGEGI